MIGLPATLLPTLVSGAHAASADTAAIANAISTDGPQFIERWHEFYLLSGTAAVTLAGLLFVSLSFNLELLLHDRYSHILAHARITLFSFFAVLLISLFFLVPGWYGRMLGVEIAISGGVLVITALVQMLRARHKGHDEIKTGGLARRGRIFIVGYAGIVAVGWAVAITHEQRYLYYLIGIVCMMLGNAVGSAWDLMVEVGRLKIRDQHERERDRDRA